MTLGWRREEEIQNSAVRRLLYFFSVSSGLRRNSFTAKSFSPLPVVNFLCDIRTMPKAPLPTTSWHLPYFSTRVAGAATPVFFSVLAASFSWRSVSTQLETRERSFSGGGSCF